MDTAISGLIVITLLLIAIFTVSYTYLAVQDSAMATWQDVAERSYERNKTALASVDSNTNGAGDRVEVTLRNDGQTRLADYERWDVIVEYDASTSDHVIDWLPFEELSSQRWWSVEGLYQDAAGGAAEAFEPTILNPGEEIVLQMWLSPTVGLTTTNRATIVTENGIIATSVFTH